MGVVYNVILYRMILILHKKREKQMASEKGTVATVDEVLVPEVVENDTDIINVVVHPVDPSMHDMVYANLKEYKLTWGKVMKLPRWVVAYMETIGEPKRGENGVVESFTHRYNIVKV
jgi:hypothetical protein